MHDFKRFPELANSQVDFYYWDSPHKQIFENFNCKVIHVTDGDTIKVEWDERDFHFPVRMLHIDALELEEGGRQSRDWLKERIEGEEVEILINPKQRVGKWGRILGQVIHQGVNINEESMTTGHSIPFEK